MRRPRATDISSPVIGEEGTRDSGRIVGKPEVAPVGPIGNDKSACRKCFRAWHRL